MAVVSVSVRNRGEKTTLDRTAFGNACACGVKAPLENVGALFERAKKRLDTPRRRAARGAKEGAAPGCVSARP